MKTANECIAELVAAATPCPECARLREDLRYQTEARVLDAKDNTASFRTWKAEHHTPVIDNLRAELAAANEHNAALDRIRQNASTCVGLLEDAGMGKVGPNCLTDMTVEIIAELAAANERADVNWASLERIKGKLSDAHADAMVAHRWFAEHFGEIMNGRDFSVKCPSATYVLLEKLAGWPRKTLP